MAARSIHTAEHWHWQGARPARPGLLERLHRAWQVASTRHVLAEMDDRMLADIGVSRAEAQLEANRAPWDVADR